MRRRTRLIVLALALCGLTALAPAQPTPLRKPDVRYEPSSPAIVTGMLQLAGVTKSDLVYDLGCGDGRIVIAAVKEFGARGVGIDIDPDRVAEAQANARTAGAGNRVEFRTEDLFETEIKKATVVTLYLWPWINLKLRPRLLKELRPGTRIVSHLHDMGDWPPQKQIEVEGHPIYLWVVPEGGAARP